MLEKSLSHKPIRVDKEIHLLKNLPNHYKLGKRETNLGTLLYVIAI
jgi:hypothetical protein